MEKVGNIVLQKPEENAAPVALIFSEQGDFLCLFPLFVRKSEKIHAEESIAQLNENV